MRFYDANQNPINHDPHEVGRTQDMEPVYEDNCAIYMYTEDTFEKTGHRIGTKPLLFEVDKIEAIDIDVLADFRMAECLHKQRMANEGEFTGEH